MLLGVERLVDLVGPKSSGLTPFGTPGAVAAVHVGDLQALRASDGHFAACARDGQTVRLARTLGYPLRYFVAKMFHGPFLIVSDRIDSLFNWCQDNKIGWQFDPLYTRMAPAHYLVEIDQIGCPDPAPRLQRFFDPHVGDGPCDHQELGAAYIAAAYAAVRRWLESIPDHEPIAVSFSGGIDSSAILILAHKALADAGADPARLRAFTLDLGGGKDAEQAAAAIRALGMESQWEVVSAEPAAADLEQAISVIEDYHPLDVECAAASIALLQGVRMRYPEIKYLLDGDGGDENLKSYPLEDSDLTISSVLRNPLLYQEGWGVDAMKHSLTYSGGLSRAYVRTYAPARHFGFESCSPFTFRSVIAATQRIPFEALAGGSAERLLNLKAEIVRAGVHAVTGIDMPVNPKRRFQDGAGDSYRQWRVSKAWCRRAFLRQWDDRLKVAWDPEAERISGNDLSRPVPYERA